MRTRAFCRRLCWRRVSPVPRHGQGLYFAITCRQPAVCPTSLPAPLDSVRSFTSQQGCYCRRHPARTQSGTGRNEALKFPPNQEDAKDFRRRGGREEGKESVTITAIVREKGRELKLRQEKNSKPYERKTESLQAYVKIVSDLFL